MENKARDSPNPRALSPSSSNLRGSPRKRARESIEPEGSRGDITSSTSMSESETPIPVNEIPSQTSEWIEMHLSKLNITTDESTSSPFGVFTSGYIEFLKNKDICPLPEVIEELYGPRNWKKEAHLCCIKACMDTFSVDERSISDVNKQHIKDLIKKLEIPFRQTAFGRWLESYLVGKCEEMKDFLTVICTRMHDRMKDFSDQLLYMIESGEKELTSGMYQELFTLFVRIFDLKIRGYTNFQNSSLMITVGNKKIISIPDALIYKTAKKPALDEKILAVVKVNKEYSNYEEKVSDRQLRNMERRATGVDHLGPNLKGQHVGEMLAVLPQSIFELQGIYGIVVEGTEVTLASLTVREQFYKDLKEGSLHKAPSEVKYSRPLNFLKESERDSLIHTFVDMKALLDSLG